MIRIEISDVDGLWRYLDDLENRIKSLESIIENMGECP